LGKHVTFKPYEITVEVPDGENLLRAALLAGVHINASCGGEGVCGKCRVLLESGALESTRSGLISDEEWDLGFRQACQSWVKADVVIRIPPESLLDRRTLTRRRGGIGLRPSPIDLDALKSEGLYDPAFQKKRGTFVTLTINQRLRGCIGNLEGRDSLVAGVERNAVNAAFHDPRFSPLKADELDRVDIEVSILTEPRSLEYKDGNELISKLRVHVDGVILQKGPFGATFLPQVWEQLPKPESFLSHLCKKAGLPADTWKTEHLDISTYQVQYFEEEK